MVTTTTFPGVSDMSHPIHKQSRPSTSSAITPRVTQRPYLGPRLATADRQFDSPKVLSPKTPESEFLNRNTISPNITPRSAARKSRINGTTPSTPEQSFTATPSSSRPSSAAASKPYIEGSLPRRQTVQTDLPRGRANDAPTQFFFASDVPAQRRTSPVGKVQSSGFVYANGLEEELVNTYEEPRRLSRSPGPRAVGGTTQEPVKRRISSRSSPAVPRTAEARHALAARSPPLILSNQSLDLRILSRTIRGVTPRSKSPLKAFAIASTNDANVERRRSSIDTDNSIKRPSITNLSKRESRASVGSGEGGGDLPQVTSNVTALTPQLSPKALVFSVPTSPTAKQNSDTVEEAISTIADARRERKILDLEISNSSLLAFNQSLERDNRRLKTEARRLRRATNSLSLNNAISDKDVTSPLDEEAESESDFSDEDSLDSVRQEGQTARDQRRMQRDFAKHKQLLDDSRQMNQSIKHCLDLTDRLIAEARHAMNRQVDVSNQDLPGRVLQRDEIDYSPGRRRGLLSPVSEASVGWLPRSEHVEHPDKEVKGGCSFPEV